IVVLEADLIRMPDLKYPSTFGLIEWPSTTSSNIEVHIKEATVVVAKSVELNANVLSEKVSPHLKLIIYCADKQDTAASIDLDTCRRRRISVADWRKACANLECEHIMAMYFALRRRLLPTHTTVQNASALTDFRGISILLKSTSRDYGPVFPISCSGETMGIIGHDDAGEVLTLTKLARSLGMRVIRGSPKGIKSDGSSTTFKELFKTCTVVVVMRGDGEVPHPEAWTNNSGNTIGLKELRSMPKEAILISLAIGGPVNEKALFDALRNKWINGAAVDDIKRDSELVGESPLIGKASEGLNLITTPNVSRLGFLPPGSFGWLAKGVLEDWING
ncbi:hypothetical protein P280DRAFT_361029, partial [Massarina eburnea CBS 473.64]